ncbi:YybS family protein [Rossellomorea sp. BNER]|uniref:YybS family protein n=1 Tax=Rossellomorea sp. BNER TaxID=2962031 RepID=UPI003AF2C913|nr:YybS family protein [Rossellomorea sp. BNER]
MKNPRILTEGALMLAIFAVLTLITVYIPVIGIVSSLVLIFPVLYFASRYALRTSLILLVGSILISFIMGSILAIPLAIIYGTTGVVMGWFIKEKKSKISLLIASGFTLLINLVIQYVVSIIFFDFDFINDMIKILEKSFDQSSELMKSLGQTPDPKVIDQMNSYLDMIGVLTPSLFLMMAFINAIIIIWVNFPILRRLGVETPKFKPFREWQLPKSFLWYYLIILILSIVLQPEKGDYSFWALQNLSYVLQVLMIVQGFSFIYYFAYIKKWPKGIVILLTILSLPLLPIIRILGIIDLGFDLRQRLQRKS